MSERGQISAEASAARRQIHAIVYLSVLAVLAGTLAVGIFL